MNITIDSNILFSALIKDSITRKIILNYPERFLFPEYIFQEFLKYKKLLLKKSNLSEKEFYFLLNNLLKKVKIIKNEKIYKYKKESIKILKDIDIKDAPFIAVCLKYSSILWSDDKALKNQKKIIVLNTKEFINFSINL